MQGLFLVFQLLWHWDIAVIDMGLAASRRKRLPRESRINLCCQLCTRSCLVPDLSAGLRNRKWIYAGRRQEKKKKPPVAAAGSESTVTTNRNRSL